MPDPSNCRSLPDHCAAEGIPQAAIDEMIACAAAATHDDGHTDCYYAGLLKAGLRGLIPQGGDYGLLFSGRATPEQALRVATEISRVANMNRAEADRLRAALETIAAGEALKRYAWCRSVAREALNGGTDA